MTNLPLHITLTIYKFSGIGPSKTGSLPNDALFIPTP